ncbi:MAG: universal stress protein [Proteobacteria bacterium]|nr:universal stress protein [Pseudomonadota bacterium]MBU1057732.1 universal stress protein [Pseudomonadota bacterium]
MFKHILLCTHGTAGAQKAEAFVFRQSAADSALQVSVLTVLDEDWRLMTGDDWLNSSKTHTAFLDHVEEQVSEEIGEEWQRIRDTYPAASEAVFLQRTGSIAETITRVANKLHCDVIAIGPYQKSKGIFSHAEKGLRARMKNEILHPLLPCPLLIIP